MLKRIISVMVLALALAGCRGGMGGGIGASVGSAPSMFIAAPPAKVQQVVIARAASRGSVIKPSGNGQLVLERPLMGKASPEVVAACGESWFGRKVRVVMTLQAVQGGTQMTERRYIVGGSPISGGNCAMPLSSDDYSQSLAAMSAVKTHAEGTGTSAGNIAQ